MPISPAANEALLVIDGAPTIKIETSWVAGTLIVINYLNGKRNRATRPRSVRR